MCVRKVGVASTHEVGNQDLVWAPFTALQLQGSTSSNSPNLGNMHSVLSSNSLCHMDFGPLDQDVNGSGCVAYVHVFKFDGYSARGIRISRTKILATIQLPSRLQAASALEDSLSLAS